MPADRARQVVQQELGIDDLAEVFEWIDFDTPLGSASISQVQLPLWCCRHCIPYIKLVGTCLYAYCCTHALAVLRLSDSEVPYQCFQHKILQQMNKFSPSEHASTSVIVSGTYLASVFNAALQVHKAQLRRFSDAQLKRLTRRSHVFQMYEVQPGDTAWDICNLQVSG